MSVELASFSVPKAGHAAAENEDAFALSPPNGRLALCDGASEGWGSGAWARYLANAVVSAPAAPETFPNWLLKVRREAIAVPQSVQSWYAEEKQAQGAFSTLLGLSLSAAPGGFKYHCVAVGDTCLFHLREDKLLARFPIESSAAFGNRPKLIGSATESGYPEPEWFAGRAEAGDRFYLLTDAIAEWFLRTAEAGEPPWASLDAVTSAVEADAEYARWVQSLRDAKALKNDDTTLIRVRLL